jgi:four helix bundle suffix protein
MVQAARSGRQNIAEGSRASATSSQTELRLVGVARASLDELLLDYEDFLRQRGMPQWGKDDPRAVQVRALGKAHPTDPTDRSDPTDPSDPVPYAPWLGSADPVVVANTLICLIHQANYLLDRQLRGLEQQFIREGGYSERLHVARLEARAGQRGGGKGKPTDRSDRSDPTDPTDRTATPPCPSCGGPTVSRTVRKGLKAGSRFRGCTKYPTCKGTRSLEDIPPTRRVFAQGYQ